MDKVQLFPWRYDDGLITLRLMIEDFHDIDIVILRREFSLESDATISLWTKEYKMESLSNILNDRNNEIFKTSYIGEGHKLNKKYGECVYQVIEAGSLRDAKIKAEIWLIELMRFLQVETTGD